MCVFAVIWAPRYVCVCRMACVSKLESNFDLNHVPLIAHQMDLRRSAVKFNHFHSDYLSIV